MDNGDIAVPKLVAGGITNNTGLAAQAIVSPTDDIVQISNSSGTVLYSISPNFTLTRGFAYDCATGRLTLASGNPYPVGNLASQTTLYYTQCDSNVIQIKLWNSIANYYEIVTSGELSLPLLGLISNTNYDVYITNNNNGTCGIGVAPWYNDTTRSISMYADGGYLYISAKSQRYVGTIRTTAAGQSEDSLTKRYVWNYYNQTMKMLYIFWPGPTPTVVHNLTTTVGGSIWQPAQGDPNGARFEWVNGIDTPVFATYCNFCQKSAPGDIHAYMGIGFDQAGPWGPVCDNPFTTNDRAIQMVTRALVQIGPGRHWLNALEGAYIGAAGSVQYWPNMMMDGWLFG